MPDSVMMGFMTQKNKPVVKEVPFNFDLERMEKAVSAPTHKVPLNLSTEEFIEWMKSKKTKD